MPDDTLEQSTALAVREVTIDACPVYDALPSQMAAITELGNFIATSGMFGCTKKEQGAMIAFTCLAERITPLQFNRKYDIIDGKLAQKAASMLGEFRATYGGDFWWKESGDDGKRATLVLTYKGRETEVSFTIEEAQRRGLVRAGGNWIKTPGEQLRARCSTKGVRMICPEIAAGVYSPEEIADIRTIRAEPVAPTKESVDWGKLIEIIGNRLSFALEYFEGRGWLPQAGQLDDIDPARAQKIIDNPAPFLTKLEELAKAKVVEGEFEPVEAAQS